MTVRQIWINGEEKLDQFEFIVPCHFGLESVMKKEITDLGYPVGEGRGRARHVFWRRRSHQPGQCIPADDGTGCF